MRAPRRCGWQFPPGFYSISYEPVVGWSVDVKMRKLKKPAEQFGEKVTEEVDEVTITAEGAGIAPGQFRDFGLSLKMPNEPGKALTFKALQTYSSGEVVRWIGPPDAEEPAPQVTLDCRRRGGGRGGACGRGAPRRRPTTTRRTMTTVRRPGSWSLRWSSVASVWSPALPG